MISVVIYEFILICVVVTSCILNELDQLKQKISQIVEMTDEQKKTKALISSALHYARRNLDIRQCPHSSAESDQFVPAHECIKSMMGKFRCFWIPFYYISRKLTERRQKQILHRNS